MWHSVKVMRYHQDSRLEMDNSPEVLGSVHGGLKSLDLSSSTYIGSVPHLLDQAAFNMGTSQGFIGCIRRLKWGHRTIRFHFDHEVRFKSAFQISECNDKLCQDVTCYNQVMHIIILLCPYFTNFTYKGRTWYNVAGNRNMPTKLESILQHPAESNILHFGDILSHMQNGNIKIIIIQCI